jgi:thiol-disulfide isomerase/thioredoxin
MKFLIILFTVNLFTSLTHAQKAMPLSSADSVLYKVYKTLHSLKSIKYDNIRELNYASENYHNVSAWTSYYDFQSADTLIGLKYQIEDLTSKSIFNGTESFELNKKVRTIQINDHPIKKNFDGHSFFYNSIITLRNVLPLLINDKTATKSVADTVINDTSYVLITVNIGKRRIQYLGNDFDAMQTKTNFIYKIAVREDNYLPYEVLQMYDVSPDFIKTTFVNIESNPAAPSEISWYYSTYTNDYKKAVSKTAPQLIAVGSLAPEWKLETYDNNKTIALSDLRGQVILLDFWIRNCGPCIASMPHLNELQNKFKDKNFKIISINSYDSKTDVSWFCNKFKTNYTVLLNGKSIAEKYGVDGYPTFFIIDHTGKILYVNTGYNASIQLEVEKVIQKAL